MAQRHGKNTVTGVNMESLYTVEHDEMVNVGQQTSSMGTTGVNASREVNRFII
jgi:hypothetical protein